jgi:hypothetical protein
MSVIIDSTPYFNGPLYTNKLYSTNIITIINDSKYVGIITTNTSCINLTTQNISFFRNININSNLTKINVPIDYLTNFSTVVDITSGDTGINRNNNISTTLGYTFNVNRNEASTNTDAYFPFLDPYTTVPINKQILTSSVIGSIKVRTPGMYLLYITVGIWSNIDNYTTTYTLFNFNTEIKINDTRILFINEMTNIQNYRQSGEYSNVLYFYNKIIMCNVISENSIITMVYHPGISGTMSFDTNGTIDTTYNFSRLLRFNVIKIS